MWFYTLLLIHCSLFGWAKDFSEDETASILLLDVPTYLGVEEGGVGSGLIFPCVYQKVFTIRFQSIRIPEPARAARARSLGSSGDLLKLQKGEVLQDIAWPGGWKCHGALF